MAQKSSSRSDRRNTKYSGRHVRKGNSKEFSEKQVKDKECANDPSWYIREGQIAKDVASLSFNNALGVSSSLDPDGPGNNASLTGYKFTAPGIIALHTIPLPGSSDNAASALNLASKNLYSFVRHMNSGHANYDSPDLMLYILALDSAYSWVFHLSRIYGAAQMYSQKNRYIGDALITAMGALPSDVRANLANFRAAINMMIVKLSAFCTPNVMSLYKRHAWMYSSIFADSSISKTQMYLYNPSILYKYIEPTGTTILDTPGHLDPIPTIVRQHNGGSYLEPVPAQGVNALVAIGNDLIAALTGSEDINIMSGDILKAYGRENLNTLALIPENYVVGPIFSDEILDQIHNTIFTGRYPRNITSASSGEQYGTYSLDSLKVEQDATIGWGRLKCTPTFGGCAHVCFEHLLDMKDEDPTPERVLVATRNMVGGKFLTDGSHFGVALTSFGSDLCMWATVYTLDDGYTGVTGTDIYVSPTATVDQSVIEKFNKAPLRYMCTVNGNACTLDNIYGDIENYTIVDYDDIDKMHQSAILSMLGVPV